MTTTAADPDERPTERVCPQCKHPEGLLTLLTSWDLYVRCPDCDHAWVIPQPARQPSQN